MNYETLKAAVANVIKTNGNEEITGQILQDVLMAIINSLGADYQFAGVATPATNPGTLDQRVFYIASAVGEVSFPNFGPLTIEDKICILKWDSAWSVEKVIDLTAEATEDSEALITSGGVYSALQALEQTVNEALDNLEEEVAQKIDKSDAETLAVGSAQGILAQSAVEAFFTYRETQARGAGAALIQSIKGKTIAWNQLVALDSLIINRLSISGTADHITATVTEVANNSTANRMGIPAIFGHSYYVFCEVVSQRNFTMRSSGLSTALVQEVTAGVKTKCAVVSASAGSSGRAEIGFNSEADGFEVNDTIEIYDFKIIDLTLLGLGNLTAAQFEALYPELYYPYNAGKLRNNDAEALETVGFNQWDEQWELGGYSKTDGSKNASTATIRAKNKIPCFPNTAYYLRSNNASTVAFCLFFYDANGDFIRYLDDKNNVGFTTPNNANYIAFQGWGIYGNTYKNDICINLSDPSFNGTYEPYWSRVLALRLSELTGIPEGGTEEDRVTMFPNGLRGLGTSYDEIVGGKATKRRGVRAYEGGDESDASVITDGTNTDYALATPIVYTDLQNADGSPFELPKGFKVEQDGTERVIQPEGETDPSAPFWADIVYPVNPMETCGESLKNLLEAMKTAGVISAYTMTWNEDTQQYEFTITQ